MPIGQDYWDVILDGMFGAAKTAGAPATLYAAWFTADPSYDDSGTEVPTAATGYARVAVTNDGTNFPGASGGVTTLATDVLWAASTASWGLVQWLGFYDASTAGNLIMSTPFAGGPRVAWPAVYTPKIPAGTLDVAYWNLSA